jgi:hypothetical protein
MAEPGKGPEIVKEAGTEANIQNIKQVVDAFFDIIHERTKKADALWHRQQKNAENHDDARQQYGNLAIGNAVLFSQLMNLVYLDKIQGLDETTLALKDMSGRQVALDALAAKVVALIETNIKEAAKIAANT